MFPISFQMVPDSYRQGISSYFCATICGTPEDCLVFLWRNKRIIQALCLKKVVYLELSICCIYGFCYLHFIGFSVISIYITKTCLFKYIENFTTKNWKFSDKNSDIFHISAQNIDCGYSLELPCQGSSNEYPQSMFSSRSKKSNVYPCKLQFYYIKVGFKGVRII